MNYFFIFFDSISTFKDDLEHRAGSDIDLCSGLGIGIHDILTEIDVQLAENVIHFKCPTAHH